MLLYDNGKEKEEGRKMNKKVALVVLISVFLWTSFDLQFCKFATANPIPFPIIAMPEEYINATISPDEEGIVYAEVNGLYPFYNAGYENVTMYYPVPPGSGEILVMMNETSLEWSYSDKNYSTVVGDFPMIEWVIKPVPKSFEIRTRYYYLVPKDGIYSFLYAMGTGRYFYTYAKETTAYVSINISKKIAPTESSIDVYTIWYDKETGKWLWKKWNYTIVAKDNTWLISLKVSGWFGPLINDLLVTINPSIPDINRDGKVNIQDVGIVARAFGTKPGHPRWNQDADINPDGKIDLKDVLMVAKNFGKKL